LYIIIIIIIIIIVVVVVAVVVAAVVAVVVVVFDSLAQYIQTHAGEVVLSGNGSILYNSAG